MFHSLSAHGGIVWQLIGGKKGRCAAIEFGIFGGMGSSVPGKARFYAAGRTKVKVGIVLHPRAERIRSRKSVDTPIAWPLRIAVMRAGRGGFAGSVLPFSREP
jgi:hypothetical protein